MNTNTFKWHFGWMLFDGFTLGLLVGQVCTNQPLFGHLFLSMVAIGFMSARAWTHARAAWRLG